MYFGFLWIKKTAEGYQLTFRNSKSFSKVLRHLGVVLPDQRDDCGSVTSLCRMKFIKIKMPCFFWIPLFITEQGLCFKKYFTIVVELRRVWHHFVYFDVNYLRCATLLGLTLFCRFCVIVVDILNWVWPQVNSYYICEEVLFCNSGQSNKYT